MVTVFRFFVPFGEVMVLLAGVAPNYPFLLVMRSLVGIGIGAVSIPFDLLAEMLPSVQRGEYLMYIEYFWTLGNYVQLCAAEVLVR